MPLDVKTTLAHFHDTAQLHWRYVAFCASACVLALLGMLLSSAAVVIGAMLISPLMGPISSLGIGVIRLDAGLMKRSLITITVGVVMAIALTALVTYLSPIQSNTAEILARTKPNLFDLMVAVVGGFVAGYATIRQTSESAVGVAIATALMPPLAVVGFSLATAQWAFAQGAMMLFLTNLLAIAACVSIMGLFYGLGKRQRALSVPLVIMLCIIGFLSIPLTQSLQAIAEETYLRANLEKAVRQPFDDAGKDMVIQSLKLRPTPEGWQANAVCFTSQYLPDAEEKARTTWVKTPHMELTLEQIVFNGDVPETPVIQQSILEPAEPKEPKLDVVAMIKSQFPLPLSAVNADETSKQLKLFLQPFTGMNVPALQIMEANLQKQYSNWQVHFIPPVMPLPRVYYANGSATLAEADKAQLNQTAWLLNRWNVDHIEVEGTATATGGRVYNAQLAKARAQAVADVLVPMGISVTAIGSVLNTKDATGQMAELRLKQD